MGKTIDIRLVNSARVVRVDESDYASLSQHAWREQRVRNGDRSYAYRHTRTSAGVKCVLMHREILGIIDRSVFCDHIDNDGLNNTRSNLRKCNRSENGANRVPSKNGTSKYLGVSRDKGSRSWRAQITKNGKCIKIGRFEDEKSAALAYNKKALELHGEFANTNAI